MVTMNCTIYPNIFHKDNPFIVDINKAIARIKNGASKDKVIEIRQQLDKERANSLKKNLPCVCFSGVFEERVDSKIIEHSGFIVLDFDDVESIEQRKAEIIKHPFIYACWISPSGNGLKALVRIKDKTKHREHFTALRDIFKDADKSGINESRVCYESWDAEIYVNENATEFANITQKVTEVVERKLESEVQTFENILKWLTNKGETFVTGERNSFIFKLAAACCRFGISETDCFNYCRLSFHTSDNSFSQEECRRTVKSAYKSNGSKFGTAEFTRDILIDRVTKIELPVEKIDDDIYNLEIRPKDVIFGEDVKENALQILENGYEAVQSTGIDELDEYFKMKKTEITLLTGIGNYGKSTFLKYLCLMKTILFGDKWAIFTPEDNPAEEFYHDLVEIYLGCDCTPFNYNKPNKETYETAYDFISKHFFYVYPKEVAPTPDYIKERFLELIIKEKVTGCIVDPFNQLANNYGSSGGRSDKYLETLLSDFLRFATINNQYFFIVAHPHKLQKDSSGNYPCPDVFDIADGAMWNNKMHNILVYHRPDHQQNPQSPICEMHTKKIKKQKIIGKKGVLQFELNRQKRRFYFNGNDYMELAKNNTKPQQQKSLYEEMQEYVNSKNNYNFEIF
jgi:hypothetical protein